MRVPRLLLAQILVVATGCASTRPPSASSGAAKPVAAGAMCRANHDARPREVARPTAADSLASHEVTFEVPGTRSVFVAAFLREELRTFLPSTPRLPGVDHTEPLSASLYPAIGSVRLVCLVDGACAEEEVLEQDEQHLRYLVTNYSSHVAAPIEYGIGELRFEPEGAVTHVRWRYSFKLRGDRFPGVLGPIGRALLHATSLDGDYAAYMDSGAHAIRAFAERIGQGQTQALR